jgi:hypothetical protein
MESLALRDLTGKGDEGRRGGRRRCGKEAKELFEVPTTAPQPVVQSRNGLDKGARRLAQFDTQALKRHGNSKLELFMTLVNQERTCNRQFDMHVKKLDEELEARRVDGAAPVALGFNPYEWSCSPYAGHPGHALR